MSLSSLPEAAEGELTLSAELQSCFSEEAHSVTLRWSDASASLESAGRVRPFPPAEARALVRQIIEAAERDEAAGDMASTTRHEARLAWSTPEERGQATYQSRQGISGDEMVGLVRQVLAKPDLTERHQRQAEAVLACGGYARAIGLFELAERLTKRA